MCIVHVRVWQAIGVLLLILVFPSISVAAGLAFTLDMEQTEQFDGRYLYEYHMENAPGDNLPLLSLCMEVGKDAALDEITGPPGWEIVYDTSSSIADMLCIAATFDFAWIPPGEYGDFSFVSPLGTTAENYYAVVGLSYDYEEADGFEGTIATPFSAPYQPGDADGDGKVDIKDLNLVRNNFGLSGEGVAGDTNDDGTVDIGDLNAVRNNFGAPAGVASVPEPSSVLTVAIATLLLVLVRRRPLPRRQLQHAMVRGAIASVGFVVIPSAAAARPIPLGNLFDDPKGTDLTQAIATDTYGAAAGGDDLGVLYVDRDLSQPVRIGPSEAFNLQPVGGSKLWADPILNDVSIVPQFWPIRTVGVTLAAEEAPKIEEGIGMHANNSITFDLDEIRLAAGFPFSQMLRFTAKGAINDTRIGIGGELRLTAIVSGIGAPRAYVGGTAYPVLFREGAWEFSDPTEALPMLSGNGTASSLFDVSIAASDKYLTLASISAGFHNDDHGVFSNAMLEMAYARGDANQDGVVDIIDLNLVRNNFGLAGDGIPGDTNDDNKVDVGDLNAVRNNFGATAGAAAVPEPKSAAIVTLFLSTLIGVFGRRIRKSFSTHATRWLIATACVYLLSVIAVQASAASFTPLGHPDGSTFSWAWDVSRGGEVVVGSAIRDGKFQPFRWTAHGGMTVFETGVPGDSENMAREVSNDGTVMIGLGFRWTEATGVQSIAELMGDANAVARGLSGDGKTIVGVVTNGDGNFLGYSLHSEEESDQRTNLPDFYQADSVSEDGAVVAGIYQLGPPGPSAFRWTEGEVDMLPFRDIGASGSLSRQGLSVSADGSVMTAGGRVFGVSPSKYRPFRWSSDGTVEMLPSPNEATYVTSEDISADGSRIVGYADSDAVFWDADGFHVLSNVLISGGVDLAGWHLTQLVGISPDGRFAVGYGGNPAGQTEAFLVELPGFGLDGDANHDGKVDIKDLNLVRNNFGLSGDDVTGDTNDDSKVDIADLNAVRNNFGAAEAAAVPEPAGAELLMLLCAGLGGWIFTARRALLGPHDSM